MKIMRSQDGMDDQLLLDGETLRNKIVRVLHQIMSNLYANSQEKINTKILEALNAYLFELSNFIDFYQSFDREEMEQKIKRLITLTEELANNSNVIDSLLDSAIKDTLICLVGGLVAFIMVNGLALYLITLKDVPDWVKKIAIVANSYEVGTLAIPIFGSGFSGIFRMSYLFFKRVLPNLKDFKELKNMVALLFMVNADGGYIFVPIASIMLNQENKNNQLIQEALGNYVKRSLTRKREIIINTIELYLAKLRGILI